MVRLWRVNLLADELRAGKVSERDKFHYVLAATALHFIVAPISLLTSPNWHSLLWNLVSMAVGLAGVALLFSANGGVDGHSFIERYLCLALPAIVRTYVLGYAIYYAALLILSRVWTGYRTMSPPLRLTISVGGGVLLLILYFATLYRAMRRVATGQPA